MQRFVQRPNLSREVADVVLDMILDGSLPEGERINEVRLAAELGVSRTPLREALARLAAGGALQDVPQRGCSVRPLSAEEVKEIYPIRGILDPAALRLAGIPSAEALARLHALNRKLERCRDPAEAVDLDDAIHLALIEGCPNRVLVDLVRQFMWRTRRYELGLMRHRVGMPGAVAAVERILAALEAGDLDLACRELEGNLMRGQHPVLAWLAEREPNKGEEP